MPNSGQSGSPTGIDGDDASMRVFMSYRRTDDANFTGRFHDKLIGVFGDANVFRDIDSIPAGTRFEDVINARLSDVDAVVALIGPTWSGRIDAASDFVRMEIAHALQGGTPVIPVLIEDTQLPTTDVLPDDLKPMLDRQTVRVRRDPDFHRDAARVIDGVREAVAAKRVREAAARRAADEAARVAREEEERRLAELARRKELEAELARANAKAQEERRAAEALAAERAQRLAELAKLEEEATQRRIADEKARVAEILESQAARERDAEVAAARAEALRRELEGGPPAGPADNDITDDAPTVADVIEPGEAMIVAPKVEPEVVRPVEPEPVRSQPPREPHEERPAEPARVFAGRRSIASAARDEVIGGVLLLVVAAWAVQALFADADYSDPFEDHTAGDLRTIVLTAALLIPFVVFFYGGNVHAVMAGTAIGYIAYAGLPQYYWWRYNNNDASFPMKPIVMTVLLAGAWFMFRRGSPVSRAWIAHKPSRYLQIGAAVATAAATVLYLNQLIDNDRSYRIFYVYLGVAVFTAALSLRRSLGATIALATLAAETTFFYVTSAIDDSYHRDRLQTVAVAAAVLTGTALWRTRRAVRVDAGA